MYLLVLVLDFAFLICPSPSQLLVRLSILHVVTGQVVANYLPGRERWCLAYIKM